MMNILYIISQIMTIIMFFFFGLSYYLKNRKQVLIANIMAQLFQVGATLLLKGFTGALMSLVMLLSYNTMYADHVFKRKGSIKRSVIILATSIFFVILITLLSYSGYASILAAIATIIFLFGLWQKNLKRYKVYGIIGAILWLLYYNYLKSIFGVILETMLIISTIISYKKRI